jgi:phage tail sheath protein FI
MPGVVITTAVRTGPTSDTVRESSQAFFVGLAEKGTADEAVLVLSLAEFEEKFGGYVTYGYLHPTVQAFFEEGGTQCYIARVVGPDAATPTQVLNNGAGTPAPAITLTPNGPGNWSDNLKIQVLASGDKRNIKFLYNDNQVYSTGLKSTNAELVNAINNSPVAGNYATAVQSGATIVAVKAATAFSGGADDRTDDTVDTDFTAYVTALELFNDAFGPGAISCPETHEINTDLIAHANAYNRVAILHTASGDDADDAKAAADDLTGETGSEHAALYYPWVFTPTNVTGVTRLIPPDGFVAGARASAHNSVGPHQPAAGAIAAARFINGVEADINKTIGDDLDDNNVNAIRIIANGVRVYGARSLSTDTENFRFISVQDTVNTVVHRANRSMEDLLFSPIDGRNALFTEIEGRLKSICEILAREGSLYPAYDGNGALIDAGFTVKCDSSINTTAQLAEGKVTAQIGLRVAPIGDKIEVTIIKSNLTGSVTV